MKENRKKKSKHQLNGKQKIEAINKFKSFFYGKCNKLRNQKQE